MKDMQSFVRANRWAAYLVKALVLIALLFAVSRLTPTMPAWGIGLTWALFSLVPATGVAYHAVINRTFSQSKFQEGIATFTVGRIAYFTFAFVVSAACTAALIIASPEWAPPMWATVVLAIPLYMGVTLLVQRVVKKIYNPLFIESKTALASAVITALLLFIVFALVTALMPKASYASAAEAFLASPNAFAASPSTLMSEVGDLHALVSGLTSYALSRAAQTSYAGYVVWQAVIQFGALTSIASMLAVCSIRPGELKRVFQRLGAPDGGKPDQSILKPYVAVCAILPLLLVAGFVFADSKAAEIVNTKEYTKAQEFIKQQVSLVVYEYDGKYYNPDAVDVLLAQTKEASERLSTQAEATLVPLINASFDKRIENVDAYLDWYYSLFADWEQLANIVTGNAEEFAKQKLSENIERGIDDSELNAQFEHFLDEAQGLKEHTMEELSKYQLAEQVPEWLVTQTKPLDVALSSSLGPSQQFLSANERIGISLVAGTVAAIIAKRIVKKVAAKAGFKAVTSRIGGLAAASSAAAAGGPGTAAAALVVSIGADIVMQKADELLNRASYREELVSTINAQRDEMLSAVRSSTQTAEVQ